MTIKNRFSEFTKPDYFARVDRENLLDIYIGLDNNGRKAIELRAKFTPRKIKSTSSIEVNQYRKPEYNTVRFSLVDDKMNGLFYKFCEDLMEHTKGISDQSEGYMAIINRYYLWKKMFVTGKKDMLSESQIMGLIGEILFLKTVLADRIGLSRALKSWSGQELTHKDFSYADTWSEVKAISKSSVDVKISSLEQLDSEKEGELAVYSLEKMSEKYNGYSLNKLIFETRALFSDDQNKDLFMTKVAIQGYEYNDYYDYYVYEIDHLRRYTVKDGFPRLTKNNVSSAIIKAAYNISLNEIKEYEIK